MGSSIRISWMFPPSSSFIDPRQEEDVCTSNRENRVIVCKLHFDFTHCSIRQKVSFLRILELKCWFITLLLDKDDNSFRCLFFSSLIQLNPNSKKRFLGRIEMNTTVHTTNFTSLRLSAKKSLISLNAMVNIIWVCRKISSCCRLFELRVIIEIAQKPDAYTAHTKTRSYASEIWSDRRENGKVASMQVKTQRCLTPGRRQIKSKRKLN